LEEFDPLNKQQYRQTTNPPLSLSVGAWRTSARLTATCWEQFKSGRLEFNWHVTFLPSMNMTHWPRAPLSSRMCLQLPPALPVRFLQYVTQN